MSRRYGRNQKRHARERIAALEEAHAREQGLAAHLGAAAARLRGELKEVARRLPEFSALLPPQVQAVEGPLPDQRFRLAELGGPIEDSTPLRARLHAHELAVFKAKIDPDPLRGVLHVRLRGADGELAYAISDSARYAMPREALQDMLIPEIAELFARELVKSWRSPSNRGYGVGKNATGLTPSNQRL